MKSNREKLMILLYTLTAKNLPLSYHFEPAKWLRVFWAKKILGYAGENINIEHGSIFNSNCSIGDYSGIGVHCELNAHAQGSITIGKYVNMGPEVVIYTQNHSTKRTDIIMQKQGFDNPKPVIIEDDVWIGRRAIILPGVTIGQGSVIGEGAVVTKNIPPYSIAVGNPARVVRSRKVDGMDL